MNDDLRYFVDKVAHSKSLSASIKPLEQLRWLAETMIKDRRLKTGYTTQYKEN